MVTNPLAHLASRLLPLFPMLKKEMKMAHIESTPLLLLTKALTSGLINGAGIALFSLLILSKARMSPFLGFFVFFLFFFLFFSFELLKVKSAISRRRKEIDQEVIFVGRYLLIKLYSGRPLLNALMETSKSKGVTAGYVREMVHDISTGTPIEVALRNAIDYSPSERFSRILFQLNNALKIGIDVTKPLESILTELTQEEELEVKKYGKKLNSLVIFYLVAAIVIPSLGISLFMVLSNFISLKIGLSQLLVIAFFCGLLQMIFISIFRSIRPTLEL